MSHMVVTGGAGLIGSHLVKSLAAEGHKITVIDNLWRGKMENLAGIPGYDPVPGQNFFKVDLTENGFDEILRGADCVYHMADIVAGIKFVFGNEPFVFRYNLLINSNTLAAAIKQNVKKFIYVGTACSYPLERQNTLNPPPLRESEVYPANPESAYGWSKLMGEYECEMAHRYGQIETGVLRLHNVYGPPCDLSPERSQVIPALCRKAIRYPSEEFVVWGSGTQRRSFLHVNDVVDALMLMPSNGMGQGAIQVGPVQSTSIREIAETVVELSGKAIDIVYDTTKPEGDKDRIPELSRATEILGWTQKVDINAGLKMTYEWCERSLRDNPEQ